MTYALGILTLYVWLGYFRERRRQKRARVIVCRVNEWRILD